MKRKAVGAVLAATMVAAMAGMTVSAEGLKIGYTCMDGTNPFFVTIEERMRELVEEQGDELIARCRKNHISWERPMVQ